jgi:hypothetical protein
MKTHRHIYQDVNCQPHRSEKNPKSRHLVLISQLQRKKLIMCLATWRTASLISLTTCVRMVQTSIALLPSVRPSVHMKSYTVKRFFLVEGIYMVAIFSLA